MSIKQFNINHKSIGALTSKPYPFVFRSWELQSFVVYDFSGGYGEWVYASVKNNKIVRIFPVSYTNSTLNFISDKTRFSFDSLYSVKNKNTTSWDEIFKKLTITFYFLDHLNKHFLKIGTLLISFSQNVNLEILSFLLLLSKKYPFIIIKKLDNIKIENNLENQFLLDKLKGSNLDLSNSNLCMLLNTNPRYEESYFNLKLKQRIKKGNFKVLSFSSSTNLTYANTHLGNSLENLCNIAEGTSIRSQELKYSIKPMFIYNSELYNRYDSKSLSQLIQNLNYYVNPNWNGINILNSTLTNNGSFYLNNFLPLDKNDIQKSEGFYFINPYGSSLKLYNIIKLKLLNYIIDNNSYNNKFYIEQTHNENDLIKLNFQKVYNLFNQTHLLNRNFFENSGTLLNVEGNFKKSTILNKTNNNSKSDWQIVRQLSNYFKKISFTTNHKINNYLIYNNNFSNFQNYIKFHFFPCTILSKNSNFLSNKQFNILPKNSKFKSFNGKFFKTALRLWLNDFFIDGKNFYVDNSLVMNKCSKYLRTNSYNF